MIIKLSNTKNGQQRLIQYLNDVDNDFKIPLSKKINPTEYAIKLLTNGVVLVSVDNGQIRGLIAGYCNDIEKGKAVISILSVKKKFRGIGISRNLIKSMIETCKQVGMRYIHVDSVNPIAVSLYLSEGFVKVSQDTYGVTNIIYLLYNIN